MPTNKKKKLVILGGGVGSMTAAWHLTSQSNWKDIYESITVYQKGWRLGGKCASGRGPNGRIEEHGLHIWLGFYDNAFDIMQNAYPILNRPAGSPLATWEDALKKHSFLVIAQKFNDQWYPWNFDFPVDDAVPGKGTVTPSLWQYMTLIVDFLYRHYKSSGKNLVIHEKADSDEHQSALGRLMHTMEDAVIDAKLVGMTLAENILIALSAHVHRLDPDPTKHTKEDHHHIISLLQDLIAWIRRELVSQINIDIEVNRFIVIMDLASTALIGLLSDGVLSHPEKLDSLDDEDLREWLSRHGALNESVNSGPLRGLYDLVFGYENGETDNPNFAAGTAIRCILRIYFTYKGAISWKMQAGMGDTVFTPLYLALKKRGVKFEFFHRVDNLGLSNDKNQIETISIGKQATLKDQEYDPFVVVKDLECWPSNPNYDQLVEGEELKEQNINLESFYTPWKDVENVTLKVGEDFDDIIFGISIASIPFVCKELLAANTKWQDMVDKVKTTRTMAFQAWMNKDLQELGYESQSPVMDAYIEPLDTWADMSQLIPREAYPESSNIRSVAYFCGPMEGGIPPRSEIDTPEKAIQVVKDIAHSWLENDSMTWWPKNIDRDGKFDRTSIVDTFHRVNIDPSERYVLSVKGSTQYRLVGYQSGFANLYLSGDWTVNGLNAGCVEATTMSGKIIGNVLTGNPPLKDVWGYGDL